MSDDTVHPRMTARCPWCNRPAHVDDCHAKVMARRYLDEIAQLPPLPAPTTGPKTRRSTS